MIIRLDDKAVKGLSLKEAVEIMRGNPGSPILLSIIRNGETKPLAIQVTRDIINVVSVKGQAIEDDMAYVRIPQFQTDTGKELQKIIKTLHKSVSPLKGLILDLRNNPGGVLDASVKIADLFLESAKLQLALALSSIPRAD